MEKTKENALILFKRMIENAWTYQRLTSDEQKRLFNYLDSVRVQDSLKGNFKQRWETLNAIYGAFLETLGYQPIGWREEETPLF